MLRLAASILGSAALLLAVPQGPPPGGGERPPDEPRAAPPDGPPRGADWRFADGPRSGPGPGMGMGSVREIVKDFDKDGDHRLNREERQAARAANKTRGGPARRGPEGGPGFGPRGGRGPGGMGAAEPGRPGPKVSPADARTYPKALLYDPSVLRTLFLEFEDADWEAELADFYHTDVEVPATLTVDGKRYPAVGVHFRGASSFFGVPAGSKRSLNVALDWADEDQRLLGYKTLNLLNSHEDPSFLHTVLYFHIAQQFTPAPQANFVKVVINGESWGVYCSAQQFDKKFLADSYQTTKGTRWKVQGSPNGAGGLDYIGEDVARYQQRYSLKSGADPEAWTALVALCKTLCRTAPDELEQALEPILDLDSALWLLALENVLVNNDGYWVRASDYAIYRDPKGKFHLVPHDANETFSAHAGFGGRGGRGGPGGQAGPGGPDQRATGGPSRQSGIELDPLVGLDDERKPLRSKLLAVPALRARYLSFVRRLAEGWLDWQKLGPVVASYRALLEPEIEADTRKLSSFEAFLSATSDRPAAAESRRASGPQRAEISLRDFATRRRAFLLAHPALKDG